MTDEEEIWEYVPGGFDDYMVSTLGNVMNIKRGGVELSPRPNQYGHIRVGIVKDGVQHTRGLALMVAQAFLEQPNEYYNTPVHLDGDLSNCRADNLVWRSRPFAVKYHAQFRNREFHDNHHLPLIDLTTGEEYRSVKEVCVKNGLYWFDVVKSYVEETYVPMTGQEFRMV